MTATEEGDERLREHIANQVAEIEKCLETKLAATEIAIEKQFAMVERRLDSVNEWRAAIDEHDVHHPSVAALTREFITTVDYETADYEEAVWAAMHRPPCDCVNCRPRSARCCRTVSDTCTSSDLTRKAQRCPWLLKFAFAFVLAAGATLEMFFAQGLLH